METKLSREDFLKKKYQISDFCVESGVNSDEICSFEQLIICDPTSEKKYLEWICRLYKKAEIKTQNDLVVASKLLRIFHSNKAVIHQENRDINKFNSLLDLSLMLTDFLIENKEKEINFLRDGVQRLFENEDVLLIELSTLKASLKYGKGTKWCTASSKEDAIGDFYDYLSRGPLFVFVNKKLPEKNVNQKIQIHIDRCDYDIEIKNKTNTDIDALKFFTKNETILKKLDSNNLIKKAIGNSGEFIMFIENPTEEQQFEALDYDDRNIKYIKNPTDKVQYQAVVEWEKAFYLLEKPSEQAQLAFVGHNGNNINKLYKKGIEPSQEVKETAVEDAPEAIRYISDPNWKLQEIAIVGDASCIKFIKNPLPLIQKLSVEDDENNIKYIKNPTYNVKVIVLTQDASLIKHIKNPSKKLIIEVAKENEEILDYSKISLTNKEKNKIIQYNPDAESYFDFHKYDSETNPKKKPKNLIKPPRPALQSKKSKQKFKQPALIFNYGKLQINHELWKANSDALNNMKHR